MFFPQTQPTVTDRLPLRPSPGPEMLPEPPPSLGWEGLVLAIALFGLGLLGWRLWRRRQPVALSPREVALANLEKSVTRIESDPAGAFVEIADILRRYWTATGQAPAESLTTAELLTIIEWPAEADREPFAQALQRADQLKFAGISVTLEEARQWVERVEVLLHAPPQEQKTASV